MSFKKLLFCFLYTLHISSQVFSEQPGALNTTSSLKKQYPHAASLKENHCDRSAAVDDQLASRVFFYNIKPETFRVIVNSHGRKEVLLDGGGHGSDEGFACGESFQEDVSLYLANSGGFPCFIQLLAREDGVAGGSNTGAAADKSDPDKDSSGSGFASFSSGSSGSSGASGSSGVFCKKRKPKDLFIDISSPSKSKSRKNSVMSRSISHSCKLFRGEGCYHGDNDEVVLDIKKLRINDGIKVSGFEGIGHRMSVALQPGSSDQDDNSKAIVLKITDQGVSDLLQMYQKDLEVTTFYQALKDYASFTFLKSVAEKTRKKSGEKLNIFFPKTQIACLDYEQVEKIFKNIEKRAIYVHLLSLGRESSSNPFIFAVVQEFVEMVPLSDDQLQQYNEELAFMQSHIKDLDSALFTSKYSNVKYAPQRRELVAFDVEMDQLVCLSLMSNVSDQTRFETSDDIMSSKVLKEAFNVDSFAGFDFESIKAAKAESGVSRNPKKMVISFYDNPFRLVVDEDKSVDSNAESSEEYSEECSEEYSEESSPEPKPGKIPRSLRTSIP